MRATCTRCFPNQNKQTFFEEAGTDISGQKVVVLTWPSLDGNPVEIMSQNDLDGQPFDIYPSARMKRIVCHPGVIVFLICVLVFYSFHILERFIKLGP